MMVVILFCFSVYCYDFSAGQLAQSYAVRFQTTVYAGKLNSSAGQLELLYAAELKSSSGQLV